MDRKGQLANVAFGGAWSEQITGNEALAAAVRMLDEAALLSADEDLRGNAAVREAVRAAASSHPKGAMLMQAWDRGLGLQNQGARVAELQRIARAIRVGLGGRIRQDGP